MKALIALNNYFNRDADGKSIISISEFTKEVRELSPEEKNDLGREACAELGVEFEAA